MGERLQINVALLGPVSAGKSTLLNSLFAEQYSDMKLQRTTATPQIYHETTDIKKCETDSLKIRENNRSINNRLMNKSNNKGLIMEDIKEIEYYVPKICDISKLEKDVMLSIYNTPGINDAKTEKLYTEYTKNKIYDLDVIILLIDINSSFNTKEEILILELIISEIKEDKKKYDKETGLMILLNKCDDMIFGRKKELIPFDEDLLIMYDQAKKVVENCAKKLYPELKYSMFPISCQDNYIYRLCQRNKQNQLDQEHIDRLASNEYGSKRWKNLKPNEKINIMKQILKNIDYDDRLTRSGFNKFKEEFGKILEKNRQCKYLTNHIKYDLCKITDIVNSRKLYINEELEMLKICQNKLEIIDIKFGENYNKFLEEKIILFMDEYSKNIINIILNKISADIVQVNICKEIVNILKKGNDCFSHLWEKYELFEKKIITNINTYYLNEIKKPYLQYETILEHLDELVKNKYKLKKIQEIIGDIFDGTTRYDFLKGKTSIRYVDYLEKIKIKYEIPTKTIIEIGFNLLISIYEENKNMGKHQQYYRYWENILIKKSNIYSDHITYIKLLLNSTKILKKKDCIQEHYHYNLERCICTNIKDIYSPDIILCENIMKIISK